jgi:hypothetical protein
VSKLKAGDRIRVTIAHEGTVKRTYDAPESIVEFTDGRRIYLDGVMGVTPTVEVIEPDYEVGQVYIDADGDVFYRFSKVGSASACTGAWREMSTGLVRSEHYPERPLRKLVPEGEGE